MDKYPLDKLAYELFKLHENIEDMFEFRFFDATDSEWTVRDVIKSLNGLRDSIEKTKGHIYQTNHPALIDEDGEATDEYDMYYNDDVPVQPVWTLTCLGESVAKVLDKLFKSKTNEEALAELNNGYWGGKSEPDPKSPTGEVGVTGSVVYRDVLCTEAHHLSGLFIRENGGLRTKRKHGNVDVRAIACLNKHPGWTNKQIADTIGCHAGTLSDPKRVPGFTRLRGIFAQNKDSKPKGYKDSNGDVIGIS